MHRTFIREQELDGVGNWVWPEGDLGLWQGPSEEWPVFKALFMKHLRNKRTCVQAGGAAGVYPRLLANIFERVYTFEPDSLNFYCLVNNCREVGNVHFYNSALGEFHGDVSLIKSHPMNVGMHRVVNMEVANASRVHQMRIDDFEFPDVDFLMLDIEHYEYYALKGGMVTILKNKPLIQLENGDYDEITKLMSQLEYVKVEQHNCDSFWKYRYYC